MIVFDGSGSMSEMGFNDLNQPRIFEAREALRTALPDIARSRRLGLVIYGPGGADMCSGVSLEFAPQENAAARIIGRVDALVPEGSTALTDAVALAARTLDHENRPATIVLVTDGKETCGGAPCRLAADLAATGVDTTVHVIGFKVRGDFFAWNSEGQSEYTEAETVSRCLADRTGGTYASAETLDELIAALRVTLGCNVLF
ncbi:VWA domain-containing protein [Sulfitobacter sp. S190]|nr:VWA domain-containing protein [Sulfitobacter sp. S190]